MTTPEPATAEAPAQPEWFGLTCGYWTDDWNEREQHSAAHQAIPGAESYPVFLDDSVLPPVRDQILLRGCVQGVGGAINKGRGGS